MYYAFESASLADWIFPLFFLAMMVWCMGGMWRRHGHGHGHGLCGFGHREEAGRNRGSRMTDPKASGVSNVGTGPAFFGG